MQHSPGPPRGYTSPYASGQTQPLPAQVPQHPSSAPPYSFPPPPVPPPPASPQSAFHHQAVPPEERPLQDLIGRLSQDGSLLVKQEIALAKHELGEKARRLGTQATMLAVGAIALYT